MHPWLGKRCGEERTHEMGSGGARILEQVGPVAGAKVVWYRASKYLG